MIEDAVVEATIRGEINKPEGELTQADLEKVTNLEFFHFGNLTDTGLKDLVKLPQLKYLALSGKPDITNTFLKELTKLKQLEHLALTFTHINGLEPQGGGQAHAAQNGLFGQQPNNRGRRCRIQEGVAELHHRGGLLILPMKIPQRLGDLDAHPGQRGGGISP